MYYLTDFVNNDGELLNYDDFRYKHNVRPSLFTRSEYAHFRLVLRRYNCPSNTSKSLEHIDPNINLSLIFGDVTPIPHNIASKSIRQFMILRQDTFSAPQLSFWKILCHQHNSSIEIDWNKTFENLYKTTNNFKLVQHQYKIFMKIATCAYMRHKMKISGTLYCCHCGAGTPETLEHIYMNCPKTVLFRNLVFNFIKQHLDQNLTNINYLHYLTIDHQTTAINFLSLVSNWYIGRKFQKSKELYWDEFLKFVKMFLVGEMREVKIALGQIL